MNYEGYAFVFIIRCVNKRLVGLTLVNQCAHDPRVVVVRQHAFTERHQEPEGLLLTRVQQENARHDVHRLAVTWGTHNILSHERFVGNANLIQMKVCQICADLNLFKHNQLN